MNKVLKLSGLSLSPALNLKIMADSSHVSGSCPCPCSTNEYQKEITIIHVAHVSRPKQKGIIKPWEEAVNSIGGVLSDSTWNADFIDAMKPHPGEIVIHKHTLDVFLSTDLQEILAKKGVEFLAVAGLLTHCCSVESTIRSAYQRDYRFIGLKDCTAAKTKERFLFVEETWPWLCKPMTKNRFLASVRRY